MTTKVETTSGRRYKRMTAEQEQAIANDILLAEADIRAAVDGLSAAEDVLGARGSRSERTRAGAVDRLEAAVEAVCEAARTDRDVREAAGRAHVAWRRSQHLRWQLAMSGRRIAIGEARKLSGAFMDEEDLVQEGFIGLLRAAKRFDPSRGLRFSTYARWWVRAQMTRAIDTSGRAIRLPGCAVEQARNLRKAMKIFEAAGVEYTVSDLALEVNISRERAEFLLQQGNVVSLDEPIEDGPRPRSVEDFLADDEAIKADDEIIRTEEIRRMMAAFAAVLSDRHRFVLSRRYGLEDDRFRTLSEISKEMGLSRERVRQIERQALKKLRESPNIREPIQAAA